jgi:hypothetical protein
VRILTSCLAIAALLAVTGCKHLGSEVNLKKAAGDAGLTNITTGDGTFKDYTATGYHKSTEIGIGVGLPFIGKFVELWPTQTHEEQLTMMAKDAKNLGADAMINTSPPEDFYTGFPLLIIGIYLDRTHGTGIDVK